MKFVNILDCTPGMSPSNEPVAILTIEPMDGFTESMMLRQKDYRRLLECLTQVEAYHRENRVPDNSCALPSTQTGPAVSEAAGDPVPENPTPGDKHLATLPSLLVSFQATFPDQTETRLRVLGAYRYLSRGPYVLLCRDQRVSPPRHFQVRVGKDFLGFEGWSIIKGNDRPEHDQEVYLEGWQWPWFIGLKAGSKFMMNEHQRCRKLRRRDIEKLLDRDFQSRT